MKTGKWSMKYETDGSSFFRAAGFDSLVRRLQLLTSTALSRRSSVMASKIIYFFVGFALVVALTVVVHVSDSQRHRYRRSTSKEGEQEYSDESRAVIDIDDAMFLGFASLLDHAGCGARLVCEVHTLSEEELDLTGQRLTDLFR